MFNAKQLTAAQAGVTRHCGHGYKLLAPNRVCNGTLTHEHILGEADWPADSTSGESKAACALACNEREGCAYYTWYHRRGCKTYTSCASHIDTSAESFLCQKGVSTFQCSNIMCASLPGLSVQIILLPTRLIQPTHMAVVRSPPLSTTPWYVCDRKPGHHGSAEDQGVPRRLPRKEAPCPP